MRATLGHELLRTLAKDPPATTTDIYDRKLPGFVLRWRPSGRHSWLARTPQGWFLLARVAKLSPEKARARAKAALGDVAAGKDLLAEKREAKARERAEREARQHAEAREALTLRAYIADTYGPWLVTHRKTGAESRDRLTSVFADLLDLPLDEITPWHIERWKTTRRKAGRTAPTLNRDLNPLKALFTRAVEWGHLARHPLATLKPEKTDRRGVVRYLSAEEEDRLRKALDARDEARRKARAQANQWRRERRHEEWPTLGTYTDHLTPLVLLALNTGLRRGELFHLRWGAIDWAQQLITVRGDSAKTGETRHVDLNAEALDVLKTWRAVTHGDELPPAGAPVFPNSEGKPFDNVQSSWEELLKDAAVTRFRFHDLRHTFASKLVQRGVPLQVVAQLLGHTSILMTQRYAHLAPSQTREAVALLVGAR